MQSLKSPLAFLSFFAVAMGSFFLIGGVRTGITQLVVPVSLAFTTICVLAGFVNGEFARQNKRIALLEETLRRLNADKSI